MQTVNVRGRWQLQEWQLLHVHFLFILLNVFYFLLALSLSSFPPVLPPVIASPQADLVSGQPLNLTCSFGRPLSSNPDLHLEWTPPKGSSQSFPDSEHHPANLFISAVGTGDGGEWRCALLRGKTVLTSTKITLKIGEHRKWEESRKYDLGMTLWPQAFYDMNLGFT